MRRVKRAGQTNYTWKKAKWTDYCHPVTTVSPTVRSKPHYWIQIVDGKAVDRSRMTPKELAQLQTFPRDYKLPDRKAEAYVQLGNAVPPLVAEMLLEEEAACCEAPVRSESTTRAG